MREDGRQHKAGVNYPTSLFLFLPPAGTLGLVSLWFLSLCSPEAASSYSLAATTVMKLFTNVPCDEPRCCHTMNHCCEGDQIYRAKEQESKMWPLIVCFASRDFADLAGKI